MLKILLATQTELIVIQRLAHKIWPQTYATILSKDQLDYMLNKFYALDVLEQQMNNGHQFFLVEENDFHIGFLTIEHNCNASQFTKIHKLYVLQSCQGKGIGKQLIDVAIKESKIHNQKGLYLNVNKYNSAQLFYAKTGFKLLKEEVVAIGNNFVMDDFVMQLLF